ncbi:MAG: arsenic efflux protein [Eubacterium sp.]|nr:arsenic efflux protein [Eubacterium sp.]
MLLDVLKDTIIDTLKLIPFLYLTYLLMEWIEDKAQEKTVGILEKARRLGPVVGAATGVIPQCGFSAAAASMYSGGVITVGTLLAVFLATSDEMLPIFISERVNIGTILSIIGTKILLGAVSGLLIDAALRVYRRKHPRTDRYIHDLCEQDHCHCEKGNIFLSAFLHTIEITGFILIITFVAGLAIEGIGEDKIGSFLSGQPLIGVALSGMIGLIPNCGASVTITELYLKGILSPGQMMAGLLVGAGVGLLILFRSDRRHLKDNIEITIALYLIGIFWGAIIDQLGIIF